MPTVMPPEFSMPCLPGDASAGVSFAPPLSEEQEGVARQFFRAIERGRSVTVLECLAQWPDVAKVLKGGDTSVMEVIASGAAWEEGSAEDEEFMTIFTALLPHANLKATDENGNDALMLAADHGHLPMLKLLLPHCDPLRANRFGETALMHAVPAPDTCGVPNCIPVLLPVSQIEAKDGMGRTALYLAARSESLDSIQLLLPASLAANVVDLRDAQGETAFESTVWKEADECADVLGACGSAERARALLERVPAGMEVPRMRALVERAALATAVAGERETTAGAQPRSTLGPKRKRL